MAGIARAAAETYARFNIPSIPLGRNKKPSVGGFKVADLTVPRSMAWFHNRPNADALGVPDGRLSGIVRIDVDEHGEQVERAVIQRAGDTPAKARTASGKLHLLYRYNGERRLTGDAGHVDARPWPDFKVDLCGGGGYSVSPPSLCAGGEYKFIGDITLDQLLANRGQLPIIQNLPGRAYKAEGISEPLVLPDDIGGQPDEVVDFTKVQDGSRDASIWRAIARACKRVFLEGGAKDDVMAEAVHINAQFPEPQLESWVRAKVEHWWRLTLEDKNEFGAGYQRRDWMQTFVGDPPMLALLCWLKEQNRPHSTGFMVADGLVGTHLTDWWSVLKLRHYRRRLLEEGWIVMIRRPTKGVAGLYRWGPTAFRELFPHDSWPSIFDTLSSK
ncbi:bifunctional DNA primase/polymerase [Bradyrhizobium elkanii]|uniref:bifunctional DNA primase/polymerase n=1 Tax=Bradyrhizobium elkanii TaxID=29448 RepID=UPI000404A47A|nr:bifunctional DNA primase/polymerase [Bradyrhizobium elkanii]